MARNATISVDGKNSVDQGDGYPHQSLGSKIIRCDLDEAINWFAMKRASESHLTPIPRDLDGVPHRLCGLNGHYSPVAAFDKDPATGELLHDCRQCLVELNEAAAREANRIEREMRAEHAAQQRRYRRMLKSSV